jgi:hypothetical protein
MEGELSDGHKSHGGEYYPESSKERAGNIYFPSSCCPPIFCQGLSLTKLTQGPEDKGS